MIKKIILIALLISTIALVGCNNGKVDKNCLKQIGMDICHDYNSGFKFIDKSYDTGDWFVKCDVFNRSLGYTTVNFFFDNSEVESCTTYKQKPNTTRCYMRCN